MLFAVGLVIAFEGILCAAFPGHMKRAMEQAAAMPEGPMRTIGLAAAVVGIVILWFVRG
ncbi:MAG: DUF2065 domain-containing protein [Proteobacteria bacterium]|nr:DUF2065 domain-containing protein [Pseudomonadota bacterium]